MQHIAQLKRTRKRFTPLLARALATPCTAQLARSRAGACRATAVPRRIFSPALAAVCVTTSCFNCSSAPFRSMSSASASSGSSSSGSSSSLTFLSGSTAAAIDEALMGPEVDFTLDELVELAGLACAQAVARCYPLASLSGSSVMVICGPGNNGADGLVCARHLSLFGYEVQVLYPKEPKKDLYKKLLKQLAAFEVPVLAEWPEGVGAGGAGAGERSGRVGLIVDAIFGFSFSPSSGIREPYKALIERMVSSGIPVASIDVPSGWDVQQGDMAGTGLKPDMLISLTAPKECSRGFRGRHHILGGRFIPPAISERFGLHLPPFPSTEPIVDITEATKAAAAAASAEAGKGKGDNA